MKIQSFSGAYESPTVGIITVTPLEVLCSSVEQSFTTSSFEDLSTTNFNW